LAKVVVGIVSKIEERIEDSISGEERTPPMQAIATSRRAIRMVRQGRTTTQGKSGQVSFRRNGRGWGIRIEGARNDYNTTD